MKLHEIHWEVTNKCNLHCKHCLPMSGEPRQNELSTKEALSALSVFHSVGVSRICFTGGEPFSRADFLEILKRTVELGMRADVITNATLLNKECLETISNLGVTLGVSLDGVDVSTNDAVRGKGTFDKIIKGLRWCQVRSVPAALYVTVTGMNFAQLEEFGIFASKYGVTNIHFAEVNLAGRALENSIDLALSVDQHSHLPEVISKIAIDIFKEMPFTVNEQCWADGTTLYMTSDGNLYVCSEVFQRQPDSVLGNIRSFPLSSRGDSVYTPDQKQCCYITLISEHISFIGNASTDCALIPMKKETIETLEQLYGELDDLYRGIEGDCRECKYPDCMGYVWLLKKETDNLYEQGVPLVQINDNLTFIHSFKTDSNGQLDVTARYPPCSQIQTHVRRCKIHQNRPLVCRLYPFGLETKAGDIIVWALHRDCLCVRRLEENGLLPNFEHRFCSIINHISSRLLTEIIQTYQAVHAISAFPYGENDYFALKEVSIASN